MPLPANGAAWPPPQLAAVTPKLREWSAWLSGDPAKLRDAYSTAGARPVSARPAQYAGGVVGAAARWWWGAPVTDLTAQRSQLHVPVAADLCQASADLLFAEPPTISVDDAPTQARLDVLVEDGMHNQLAESAEIGAGLGSGFLRVTWDRDVVPDHPFLTSVHADSAVPEFRWGRLVAVTFWRKVFDDGQIVRRHLERHELDSAGDGVVLHGLYEGTRDNLGMAVPLAEAPSTAGLAGQVNADGAILTGSPGLAVVHVPNARPQRRWRDDPLGTHLGRSVLDGQEPLMDALDEAWSSWMRDLRHGKARILAARSALTDLGAGNGAAFDVDREVYESLNVLGRADGNLPIEQVQFAIRVEEHERTTDALHSTIVRSAGFSAQTFGDGPDGGGSLTATEVNADERRTFMTRDRMVRNQRPAVSQIVQKLLAVDAFVFGTGGLNLGERPTVAFADSVQESPEALARTAELLGRARAASTATLVGMVHPEWSDDQVRDEVAAIRGEDDVPDPLTLTPDQP